MKTITKIFLTLTMLFALSFVQAQTFDVEGYILSSPQQAHQVVITYDMDTNNIISDTVYTDTLTGFYSGTFNFPLFPGIISMSYEDCNGFSNSSFDFIFPVVDFGTMDFCPSTTTVYDASFNVQFMNFNTMGNIISPINFELSWDDGITFTTHTTDSIGFYYETLTNAPASGNAIIRYTDCNGNVILNNQLFSQMNPDVLFMELFCNAMPTTGFTAISVINTNGVPVSIDISTDGGATFTTITTDSLGHYSDTLSNSSLIATFTDCNGNTITDTATLTPFINALFLELDFCPVTCQANFFLEQEIIFDTTNLNILFTGNMMIMNLSIGSNITYTWDFGDGSPTYTGINFTHAYTTAGSYNLCLSIDNGTGCADTYCEILDIDSNGILTGKTNTAFLLQMGNGDVETEVASSINDLEKDVQVNIYPNPASNFINISLNSKINENATIAIYDLTGKLVQNNKLELTKGNQNIKIELTDLKKGMYIAQLKTVKGTLSSKLTIK